MPQKPPCNFSEIESGSETSNPCSPVVDAAFRGIKIDGPKEVFFGPGTEDLLFGGFTKMIVAGVCKLEYQTLGLRGEWNQAIVLVATDTRTRKVFSGRMMPFGSPAEPLDPLEGGDLKPEDYAGLVVGSYFNPNLARDLNLPEKEAEYDVFATLGPYKSNVVHVKVSRLR